MKTAIITIGLAIFSVASLFAQHVPPNHGDSGPTICWGYSVGRAFGKTWTQTSDCNSRIINKNEVGNKQGDLYFDWYPNYSASNINVGDIIEFGPGHVAYVTGTVSGIKLDFVENEDSDVEKKDIPIDWVINGHSNPDVVARGNPTGYWRRKSGGWPIKLQNEFSGGTIVWGTTSYTSPHTFNAGWNNNHDIDADMHEQPFQGYVRLFENWTGGSGTDIENPNSKATKVKRTDKAISSTKTVTASFKREFDITFENNFVGVGNAGDIKVNGTTYTLPEDPFPVPEGNNITGQCVSQVYDGISYTFSNWSTGSSSCQQTFTPDDHATYTANHTGKPVAVTITSYTGPVGSNIHIEWQEHSNANVSQYQVWRKYKDGSTGQWNGPTLLTTLNRGTTSYTDYDFTYTSGYTDDLLMYDIRAYYSVESSYADPNWITIYGQQGPWKIAANEPGAPSTYALGNFPNPFNPETRITFQLAADARVSLAIFNLRGQHLRELDKRHLLSGYYSITWDGTNANGVRLASGIYLARLQIEPMQGAPRVLTQRMLLLK